MTTGKRISILIATASVFVGGPANADFLTMSGAQLYGRFCASCHGTSGRGDGPVSKSFKSEVPDLTLISRRHGGKFPAESIERIIDGRTIVFAHGTREMPVWGEEFARTEIGNSDAERASRLMIKRLLEHVQSLQRPTTKDIDKD